jgi:hypothetical protein
LDFLGGSFGGEGWLRMRRCGDAMMMLFANGRDGEKEELGKKHIYI